MKERLRCTKDYSLFEMHDLNRKLHGSKTLEESMRKNGFMPSSPIQVIKNGNGKFKIIRGHNRFDVAQKLGLPIWFVEDNSNTDIFDLEGSSKAIWSSSDFLWARANAGDEDCQQLLKFQKKHNLPIAVAASLVGGQSAGSNNKVKQVKMGTFKVGEMNHANRVASIVDFCTEMKISFSNSSAFVRAVSAVLRVPAFDEKAFMHKLKLFSANIRKRSSWEDYLDEIDALYNYGLKKGRMPLAFRAKEELKKRSITFGLQRT